MMIRRVVRGKEIVDAFLGGQPRLVAELFDPAYAKDFCRSTAG
jgi:ATP-dependent 26S proteasome regulatory subunit